MIQAKPISDLKRTHGTQSSVADGIPEYPDRGGRARAHPRRAAGDPSALPGDGHGKLALPGGYQMLGQTWQTAGAAEVLKETGVMVDAAPLRVRPSRPHRTAVRTCSSAKAHRSSMRT